MGRVGAVVTTGGTVAASGVAAADIAASVAGIPPRFLGIDLGIRCTEGVTGGTITVSPGPTTRGMQVRVVAAAAPDAQEAGTAVDVEEVASDERSYVEVSDSGNADAQSRAEATGAWVRSTSIIDSASHDGRCAGPCSVKSGASLRLPPHIIMRLRSEWPVAWK